MPSSPVRPPCAYPPPTSSSLSTCTLLEAGRLCPLVSSCRLGRSAVSRVGRQPERGFGATFAFSRWPPPSTARALAPPASPSAHAPRRTPTSLCTAAPRPPAPSLVTPRPCLGELADDNARGARSARPPAEAIRWRLLTRAWTRLGRGGLQPARWVRRRRRRCHHGGRHSEAHPQGAPPRRARARACAPAPDAHSGAFSRARARRKRSG